MSTIWLYNGHEIIFERSLKRWIGEEFSAEYTMGEYLEELNSGIFWLTKYDLYKRNDRIGIYILKKPKLVDYCKLPFFFIFFVIAGIFLLPYYLILEIVWWISHWSKVEHLFIQGLLILIVFTIWIQIAEPHINKSFEQMADTVKIIHEARVSLSNF